MHKICSVLIWILLSVVICLWGFYAPTLTNVPVSISFSNNSVSTSLGSFGVRQGSIRGALYQYSLPNKNHYSDKSTDNANNSCQQVTTIERIERIFLSLLFFCLCLWLLYYVAGRSLITGYNLRFCLACLLGIICFLTCIEFADAASAFGVSGWTSIWRSFLCAYVERDCDYGCTVSEWIRSTLNATIQR